MTLGEIILKYLDETGISMRELGRRAGVSHQTIANVVKGDRTPDLATYQKLAKAMGKTPADLFAEEAAEDLDEDAELMEYLQELRTRPEMRMLFEHSKGMTMEQVKAIVAMIEGFRNT